MALNEILNSARPQQSFNMTPIIDIAFQLIIFFALVCRFVDAENFPVSVPDQCEFAQEEPQRQAQVTTVTVMQSPRGGVRFAVGAEVIEASTCAEAARLTTDRLDAHLKSLPEKQRVVTLRIDKDVRFAAAQYALAAVASSAAVDIQVAAIREPVPASDPKPIPSQHYP